MDSNDLEQPSNLTPPAGVMELSDREREILVLVAGGASNKEIALQLVISPNTVKVHLRNIFGKLGVASRTEAALYAVRAGLVQVAAPPAADTETTNGAGAETPAAGEPAPPPAPAIGPAPARPVGQRGIWLIVVALLALALALPFVPWLRPGPRATATLPAPTSLPRWQERSVLPDARTHLALTTLDNHIYAIGGETEAGVSGATARFELADQTWHTLAPKPVPVAGASAAVVGGLIYLPGGQLASGSLTSTVEAYDPSRDAWLTRAPLPVPLSGYALTQLEGRLYLFGGWNGNDYVATVYEYDPADDEWTERTRMPTARGFAVAAPVGGTIYVIGGTAGDQALPVNEAYVPAQDVAVANPWAPVAGVPAGHSVQGAATIAGTIYVVGRDEANGSFLAWAFDPDQAQWAPLELAAGFTPDWVSAVALQTQLYVLGHNGAAEPSTRLLSYQALYTTIFPVITGGE